jgi:hypothetical protein
MATVVLQYAGAAVGTFLGGPVGGIIGRAAGAIAGNIIDQRLFGPGTKRVEGPRLGDLRVMASEEGAPIPALWGRMRIAGQVIWATNLEEVSTTTTQKSSAKGSSKTKTTEYSYFANFAVGLCEGEIDRIGRVWADGKDIDISKFTVRLYRGTEDQAPDALIVAKEGAGNAPAYRGLAYIVFERLPLEQFGNRLPQLAFEVIGQGGGAEQYIRAVNIIPGTTEFGYDTSIVTRSGGAGVTVPENAHVSSERADWTVSIDDLEGACKNLKAASLVVSWFGTDLRCGSCLVQPGVESASKITTPDTWVVSGTGRAAAHVVSTASGKPAFGGTPSDASVVHALQDLRSRGLATVFYPFILMDIPVGNGLPSPYGAGSQAAYPWRGRITCMPAPGQPGTVDKTAAAATQLQNLIGSATPAQFTTSGTTVTYTGTPEWSYRRMVLHYAKLCAAAGGVDAFVIGSELRGLTTLRSAAGSFPFVSALMSLADDVKSILPTTKVTYAADWSEYAGYRPADASDDLYFHLDPLWASSAIDAVGIDNYLPVTDWRDGTLHLDRLAGTTSIYDPAYLTAGFAGGEGYDWYYASDTARTAQARSPITDGAYGKPWVFRVKDIKSWWLNSHYNRPGGVQQGTATAWVPQSKPIWFTEAGCPAVDKGTNQPNAFYDAKSSESALPYYSSGNRDDLLQARFLTAFHQYWGSSGAHNPVSAIYGKPMVDAERLFIWAWDSRPYPVFPGRSDIWSDGENFTRGHWLNGRVSAIDVSALMTAVCQRYGLTDVQSNAVAGLVDGFMLERPMSGRAGLENLAQAFALDAVESEGLLKFRNRRQDSLRTLVDDDYVETAASDALFALNRAQETDLPGSLKLTYIDATVDYRSAVVEARKQRGKSSRELVLDLPCATSQANAWQRAEVLLQENWGGRESLTFALPPSQIDLEPGDVVTLGPRQLRISQVHDGAYRKVTATSYEAAVYDPPPAPNRSLATSAVAVFGKPDAVMMDLAMAATASPAAPWIAAHATPWPGQLALLKRTGATSFVLNRTIAAQATMGVLLTPLSAGAQFVFDRATSFDVTMKYGALASASESEVLNGTNLAAVGDAATGYEIIQFASAVLIAPNVYRVSTLLRGLAGSEAELRTLRAAGSDFVLLNQAVVQADVASAEATSEIAWKIGPAQNDAGHPSYLDITSYGQRRGFRPLSPCQLAASADGADIMLRWVRRTRTDGDSWEAVEVPLGEETERYRIDIGTATTVLRSVETTTPQYRYLAADAAADFGALPATLVVSVAQISASYGPGTKRTRTLHV